jgi:DNA-binding transcriptional regulator YhcF (GntR family)
MAPSLAPQRPRAAVEHVREHLLTALHVGQLAPGDRVTSVRRLADLTGVNRKTVHRAYQQLAREGFLVPRPGAGTFVAEARADGADRRGELDLLRAVNHCRAEAAALGMPPEAFAEFLCNYVGLGLRGLPVAVVECNDEQIGIIAVELRKALGVAPRAVRLATLVRNPRAATRGVEVVVTTDCPRTEVAKIVRDLELPVHRVAFDSRFPKQVIDSLRQAPLVMIASDECFATVFRRLLGQIGADAALLDRLWIVEAHGAREALSQAGPRARLWLSPLVAAEASPRTDEARSRLDRRWRLAPRAIERLRVALACDVALGRDGHNEPRPTLRRAARWHDLRPESG